MIKNSRFLIEDTLKETSKDNSDINNIVFMTNCSAQVINFDKVKEEYIRELNLSKSPCSVDAIIIKIYIKKYSGDLPSITFIEFKNGKVGKTESFEIRKKIVDSLLIFFDISKTNIGFTRKVADFILLYNESKYDSEETIQKSQSREVIIKKMGKLSKKPIIKFGLEDFEQYCFKNVFTYTEVEFEKNYIQKYGL